MKTAPDLRTLQRWFAIVMEHPATAEVAMATRSANALVPRRAVEARKIVLGNARMTPAAQLQVYNGGYLARLVEVMQGDYGAVQHVVGEDTFRGLVARYLVVHPSRHPNLNGLGRHFPAFLARQRSLARRAFLVELARLELALSIAFDAPEFKAVTPEDMANVPAERWDTARFVMNPTVQLLAFRYPVDHFYQPWKEGKPIAVPARSVSWVCVYRKDDRVWRQRLAKPAHAVLSALVEGRPLGKALERARGAAQVNEWFQGFARDGLFTGIEWRSARGNRKRS